MNWMQPSWETSMTTTARFSRSSASPNTRWQWCCRRIMPWRGKNPSNSPH
jgi:hypothetical protein